MAQLLRKLRRAVFNYDPSFCDMYQDAHARTAAEEYLSHIRRHLHEQFGDRKLDILDAGCQAGRLLIPLAEEGHHLIGVDTSGFALRRAHQHAKDRHLSVPLYRGNIASLRRWVRPASLDAVLCLEVLYLCEDHRELLRLLADSVKVGGLVCISHRPASFYVADALAQGKRDLAVAIAHSQEGPTLDSRYHNWQTEQELTDLYQSHSLRTLGCYPVDHAIVELNLSSVTDPDISQLLTSAHTANSTYRIPAYLLVVAQKA